MRVRRFCVFVKPFLTFNQHIIFILLKKFFVLYCGLNRPPTPKKIEKKNKNNQFNDKNKFSFMKIPSGKLYKNFKNTSINKANLINKVFYSTSLMHAVIK